MPVLAAGAIRPIVNHGLPCMSMGFLLPKAPGSDSAADTAVVWRGLMVQKAVQQLLFDVDWRDPASGAELDVLVIDMPPGTGDVPLTLGQLVNVDGKQPLGSCAQWRGEKLIACVLMHDATATRGRE